VTESQRMRRPRRADSFAAQVPEDLRFTYKRFKLLESNTPVPVCPAFVCELIDRITALEQSRMRKPCSVMEELA
jgi:hypothetical protein